MPIDLPATPGFIRSSFGLEFNTQTFTGPLARNTQRLVLSGGRWVASYTLRRMKKTEPLAAAWIAFFLKCEGMANTFNAYDPDRKTPRGIATGTPLVKGAGQTGSSLLIDGCTPNITGWLKAGDYFACNNQLHQLTQDADTDGSGETTLQFKAMMRSSPADNAPITTDTPTCTMILVDDRQGMWEADANGVYEEKTFSAYEVFS